MAIKDVLQKKIAVVVIDLQNDYINENGAISKLGLGVKGIQKALLNLKTFIDAMRQKKVPIIYAQMTEDENLIAKNIKDKRIDFFGSPELWSLAKPGTWGYELAFEPKKDEQVFQKNTYDVFSNPKFKEYLKKKQIETLIFIGGYAYACVETSVRSAITNGYNAVLATDLVFSPDKMQEFHKSSLKLLGMLFAYGAQSEEIIKLLEH
jgi:ureidoacrylate peracid hydrolase